MNIHILIENRDQNFPFFPFQPASNIETCLLAIFSQVFQP